MESLRILIFNWRDICNPKAGGAEVFTHENAKRWVKLGNEVTLLTSKFLGGMTEETLDGIHIFRGGGRFSVYSKTKKMYNNFYKGKFDLVIDEINTRPFFTVKYVHEPVVALIHQLAREYWFYETPFPISYIGRYLLEPRWLNKYVTVPTITVSNSTKTDLVNLGFQHVHVVSEGITFQPSLKVPKKAEQPTCIFVGRLTKSKRPNDLLEAFRQVKKRVLNAQLWIVGEGYLKEDLQRRSPEGVKFFGYVKSLEKIRLLKKSWILINTSVREGFGLNIIEANACGTPCIGYRVNGLKDTILDGETGMLVLSGSIQDLTQAIQDLLQNNTRRLAMEKRALEYSKQFSWDKSAKEFLRIIQKVC